MRIKRLAILLLFTAICQNSDATHLRAGEIIVRQLPNSLTCRITVRVYTNTASSVLFGGIDGDEDWLNFGDGTGILIPEVYNTARPDLGPNIGMAEYTIDHTYPSLGPYRITYSEPNRNESVMNFDNSVNSRFYLESYITLGIEYTYQSPEFLLPPIFRAISGEPYTEAMGAIDPNDFTLRYELMAPRMADGIPVSNFRIPGDFSIDRYNGICSWNTKFMDQYVEGEIGMAIKVNQIVNGQVIGYVVRDFQVQTVSASHESEGTVEETSFSGEHGAIYIPVNENHAITLTGISPDSIDIIIKSELENFPDNFSWQITDSTLENQQLFYKVVTLNIQPTEEIVRDNPYLIVTRFIFKSEVQRKADMAYLIMTRDIPLEPETKDPVTAAESGMTVSVHPNPVSSFLTIDLNTSSRGYVRIIDSNGVCHRHAEVQGTSVIDVSSLPAGAYLALIRQGNQFSVTKFIRE